MSHRPKSGGKPISDVRSYDPESRVNQLLPGVERKWTVNYRASRVILRRSLSKDPTGTAPKHMRAPILLGEYSSP